MNRKMLANDFLIEDTAKEKNHTQAFKRRRRRENPRTSRYVWCGN